MPRKEIPLDELIGCNVRGRLQEIESLLTRKATKQALAEVRALLEFFPEIGR